MKSRTLWTGCLVTFLAVLFFLGLSGVVLVFLGKGAFFSPSERVGVVEITGLLSDSRTIIKHLDRYRDDDSIKAIVLRINSPGGTVGPAQEVLREVEKIRAKKKTRRPDRIPRTTKCHPVPRDSSRRIVKRMRARRSSTIPCCQRAWLLMAQVLVPKA